MEAEVGATEVVLQPQPRLALQDESGLLKSKSKSKLQLYCISLVAQHADVRRARELTKAQAAAYYVV